MRCEAILLRDKPDTINRTMAWTLAGLVLYAVAMTFPFLEIEKGGVVQQTALLTGVHQLYQQDGTILAILVFMTCVLIPLIQMGGLLYVFTSLKSKVRFKYAIPVFRLFQHVKPWSMMEIYMLGILVSMIKLGKMATIMPGPAVTAFGLLTFVLTFAVSAVDAHLVWEQLGRDC